MPSVNQETTTAPASGQRRHVSAVEWFQKLRDAHPDYFTPYDRAGISSAAQAEGMPATVVNEIVREFLSLHKSELDPGYRPPTPRAAATLTPAAEAATVDHMVTRVRAKIVSDMLREGMAYKIGGKEIGTFKATDFDNLAGSVAAIAPLRALLKRGKTLARSATVDQFEAALR